MHLYYYIMLLIDYLYILVTETNDDYFSLFYFVILNFWTLPKHLSQYPFFTIFFLNVITLTVITELPLMSRI